MTTVQVRFQDFRWHCRAVQPVSVGVGDDDGLVQAIIVCRVEGEIFFQRDDVAGDVHQPAPDAVAAIGDVCIGQRVVLVAEGPQGEEQVLVAAVAGHDLLRLQLKVCRRCPQQLGTGRVGVEAELFHLGLAHRPHHGRRGEIRAFVGVQLDVLLVLRLFARGVGSDSFQRGRKKTAHVCQPPFLLQLDLSAKGSPF